MSSWHSKPLPRLLEELDAAPADCPSTRRRSACGAQVPTNWSRRLRRGFWGGFWSRCGTP